MKVLSSLLLIAFFSAGFVLAGPAGSETPPPPKVETPPPPKTETKPDPKAQWEALYQKGNSWTIELPSVGMKQRTEVLESAKDGEAKVSMAALDGEGKPFMGIKPTQQTVNYTEPPTVDPDATPDPSVKELGHGEETIAGIDCTWVETNLGEKKFKTWTSKKYGSHLIARTDLDGKTLMKLVEFHDASADAKVDPKADWLAVNKPGAWWIYENQNGTIWIKTEVMSVEGTTAKVKKWTKSKASDKFEGDGADGEIRYVAPPTDAPANPDYTDLGKGEETIKLASGDMECTWVEGEFKGKNSKNWLSKKYRNALIVRADFDGKTTIKLREFHEGK